MGKHGLDQWIGGKRHAMTQIVSLDKAGLTGAGGRRKLLCYSGFGKTNASNSPHQTFHGFSRIKPDLKRLRDQIRDIPKGGSGSGSGSGRTL